MCTRNVANRISETNTSSYTCFSFIELVFWTLVTRDIVYWEMLTVILVLNPYIITIYNFKGHFYMV